MGNFSRRDFLKTTAFSGLGTMLPLKVAAQNSLLSSTRGTSSPMAISSMNGAKVLDKVVDMMKSGSDALDAAIAGVNVVEDDPNDDSVGYGGLPNEEGVVELDAAVMHGPTHRAGAVASLRNVRNPSSVARVVMERTDHVLLVGDGALQFARAHGFKEENLLTESSREKWLKWKENLSKEDDWLPPHTIDDEDIGNDDLEQIRNYGTIHISALDAKGNLSCVTTTSGLSYKIPGRVGDSPIIGAGLYLDNEVGSAGSTGRGEANLLNCSCFMVVESMRQGKTPEEACLLACDRIVHHNKEKRHLNKAGKYKHNVKFYAIDKNGVYGGASIWGESGGAKSTFAVHNGTAVVLKECAYLYAQ